MSQPEIKVVNAIITGIEMSDNGFYVSNVGLIIRPEDKLPDEICIVKAPNETTRNNSDEKRAE